MLQLHVVQLHVHIYTVCEGKCIMLRMVSKVLNLMYHISAEAVRGP